MMCVQWPPHTSLALSLSALTCSWSFKLLNFSTTRESLAFGLMAVGLQSAAVQCSFAERPGEGPLCSPAFISGREGGRGRIEQK